MKLTVAFRNFANAPKKAKCREIKTKKQVQMEYRVQDDKKMPLGARFLTSVQTGPGAHPRWMLDLFLGVKRPEREVTHPHLLPLLPLWALMACFRKNFTFYFLVSYQNLQRGSNPELGILRLVLCP